MAIDKYQKSVVAFIDLLGFKSSLKHEENLVEILNVLRRMKAGESSNDSSLTQVEGNTHVIKIKPSISVFSDSMVISASESLLSDVVQWHHLVVEILNIVQQLSNFIIKKGYILRGGLTIGDLYHADGVIVGQALVEAYEIESEHAKYPRVMASNEIVEYFNSTKNGGSYECFCCDDEMDMSYYLDYLPAALCDQDQALLYKNAIRKNLNINDKVLNNPEDKKIHEKWVWFEKYFERSLEKSIL